MFSLNLGPLVRDTTRLVLVALTCAVGARAASAQIVTTTTAALTPTPVFHGEIPVATVTVTASDGSFPNGSASCAIQVRAHNASYSAPLQNGVATMHLTSVAEDPITGAETLACGYSGSSAYTASNAAPLRFYLVGCSVYTANSDTTVSLLDCATGTVQSTQGTSAPTATAAGVAVDSQGAAWAVNNTSNSVVYFYPGTKPNGTAANGNFSGAGLAQPTAVAIDGADQVWIANGGNSVSAFTHTGAALSPTTGYGATTAAVPTPYSAPSGIAVDQAGSVWITNSASNTVTRIFGSAAPAIVPLVTNVTTEVGVKQ